MKTYQYTQFLQSPLMERFMANASEIFDLEGKLSVLGKQNPERSHELGSKPKSKANFINNVFIGFLSDTPITTAISLRMFLNF